MAMTHTLPADQLAEAMKNPLYKAGRIEGMRQGEINATVRILRALTRNFNMSLEEIMAAMELPSRDRKTYRKIFAQSAR